MSNPFYQLLARGNLEISDVHRFTDALQAVLVEAGSRPAELAPYRIPVDFPDRLHGLNAYYIRVHQSSLNGEELDSAIESVCLDIWGDAKACQRVVNGRL